MLRRTKADVSGFVDLLPKKEIRLCLPLTQTQKDMYIGGIKSHNTDGKLDKIFADSSDALAQEGARGRERLQNLLQYLRKVCTHPALVGETEPSELSPEQVLETSSKFLALNILLRRIVLEKKGKLIIFSSFTKTLDACEELLKNISEKGKHFKWCSVVGRQHRCRRSFNIRLFNHPESSYDVLLVSTRAGGEGINLTAAQDSV